MLHFCLVLAFFREKIFQKNHFSNFLLHQASFKGFFTFYGGHDPEDYQHRVGDEATVLDLHPNSPGFRLILNNVLFPAARKKPQKT